MAVIVSQITECDLNIRFTISSKLLTQTFAVQLKFHPFSFFSLDLCAKQMEQHTLNLKNDGFQIYRSYFMSSIFRLLLL